MTNSDLLIDHNARHFRRKSWNRAVLIGAFVAFICGVVLPPASADDAIAWSRMFRLADGRLFLTDGAFSLEADLAKPAALPPGPEMPAATGDIMGRYMAAEPLTEVELDDLESGSQDDTYETPDGLPFAAKYVELLQDKVPDASLRIRGDREPVVIVDDGKPVGLIMAKVRVTPP